MSKRRRCDSRDEDALAESCSTWVVGVHAGAGWHSPDRQAEYLSTCRRACLAAGRLLSTSHGSRVAASAAAEAVSVLEDAHCTNAGRGSCLTLDGTVECDAAVSESGTGLHGAVGAVRGIRSPVRVALDLLEGQRDAARLSLGRLPPQFLVGEGAHAWAMSRGHLYATQSDLMTVRSRDAYRRYMKKLDSLENSGRLDTVGAVVLDGNGCVAAACSSGGLALKQPGRVGQASQLGAGFWTDVDASSSVVTSGAGEYLVRTLLAREVSSARTVRQLHDFLTSKFLHAPALAAEHEKFRGQLESGVLMLCQTDVSRLLFGHTSRSMALACWDSGAWSSGRKPRSLMSRQEVHAVCVGELPVICDNNQLLDEEEIL